MSCPDCGSDDIDVASDGVGWERYACLDCGWCVSEKETLLNREEVFRCYECGSRRRESKLCDECNCCSNYCCSGHDNGGCISCDSATDKKVRGEAYCLECIEAYGLTADEGE